MKMFRDSVSAAMLGNRISDLYAMTSRAIEKSVEGINRAGVGERVYQAVRYKTGDLVAFAVQFSVKTNLKPKEAEAVLKDLFVVDASGEYYWQRFNDIPNERRGVWATAQIEYLMAGNAFLDQCGKTGIRECDDIIRQFGAETFRNVFELIKKEVKAVRVYTA
jgi:hypothetical protein